MSNAVVVRLLDFTDYCLALSQITHVDLEAVKQIVSRATVTPEVCFDHIEKELLNAMSSTPVASLESQEPTRSLLYKR